jgi:hypothetical protein
MNMKNVLKSVAVLVTLAGGCATTKGELYCTFRADTPILELVPAAEAATRTSGYTIVQEDLSDANGPAFIAARPGTTEAMLVQIGTRKHLRRTTVVCTQHCMTTFMVTPLSHVDDRFAVIEHISDADEDHARDLLGAIAEQTMPRRDLPIP